MKVPKTHAAEHAILQITRKFFEITYQISSLKEPGLKSFIANVEYNYLDEPVVDDEIWRGIVGAARLQLETRRRWRTGKGKWRAIIERIDADEDMVTSGGVATTLGSVEVEGKKAAVAKTQEFLRRHADQFTERSTLEAYIEPVIERSAYADK